VRQVRATRAERASGRLAPLDGVRAVAIFVVMAYHSGIPGIRVGGFYGQDAFFVLSGLLITSLLLREGGSRQAIDLLAFWGRRVRRLLPALVVLLLVVDIYVTHIAPVGRYPAFAGDAQSTLFYYANWHLIAASSNYFAETGHPSLLTHTWSLAIEEQFYLVWPLVLLAVLRVLRRRADRVPHAVLALSTTGALMSAGWMARLYAEGASPSRLYYGSDTHAQCLLVGAALAAGLRIAGQHSTDTALFPVARARGLRWALAAAGAAGAVGACGLWTQVSSANAFAYDGGFLCVALCTAAVLVSIVCVPTGVLARILGCRPIAFVGLVSYGMYLWYFPTFAVIDGANTGLRSWSLFAVRAAAVFGLAVLSWYVLERPLQRGKLLRISAPTRFSRTRPGAIISLALLVTLSVVQLPADSSASAAAEAGAGATLPLASAAHGGTPLRVLLVGDSTGATLSVALSTRSVEHSYNYRIEDRAILGCGLVVNFRARAHGVVTAQQKPCSSNSAPSQLWPALLANEVAQDRPDVVLVVAGRWEVSDRQATPGGRWQNITEPADQSYVRTQLETAVAIGSSGGAHVDLTTAPCFSSGEQPNGSAWPEDSPERLALYNTLVHDVANAHRDRVSVLPMDHLLCPDGRFHTQLDGLTVRAADGIHYPYTPVTHPHGTDRDLVAQTPQTRAFGTWIARRIMPTILAAGRADSS
jgi:peptidoglycan/LPS O-acetylase OafA/YrhL